jgi:hypothetical protein
LPVDINHLFERLDRVQGARVREMRKPLNNLVASVNLACKTEDGS